MQILNRKEFMALEGQHVFAKYNPAVCDYLAIKTGNCGTDFVEQSLDPVGLLVTEETESTFDTLCRMERENIEVPIACDSTWGDGMYDEDQLFMVFSRKDVILLIARLFETLPGFRQETRKTSLECMFNNLDDIHEGSDAEVKRELSDLGIDLDKARKRLEGLIARLQKAPPNFRQETTKGKNND